MADNHSWKNLRSLLGGKSPRRASDAQRPNLCMELLEDRMVPAVLDLTTAGAIGEINGALFHQAPVQPAGSGVIHSFVRLQQGGANNTVEQGYNTNARPLQFDANKSPTFTRGLQLSAIPTVDIGGVTYREFLLDINQDQNNPLLSLDELRLFVGSASDLSGYNVSTNTLAGLSAVYDLGASGGNWVRLNSNLNPGSGKADMILDIPDALLSAQSGGFVYLFSKFGVNVPANGGFEEWAVAGKPFENIGGVISGTVFDSSTNTGLGGWTVFIDTSGTGVYQAGDIVTTTQADGSFRFTGLATSLGSFSSYTIVVMPPSNWVAATNNSLTFDLTNPNQDVTNANFYFTQTVTSPPK